MVGVNDEGWARTLVTDPELLPARHSSTTLLEEPSRCLVATAG